MRDAPSQPTRRDAWSPGGPPPAPASARDRRAAVIFCAGLAAAGCGPRARGGPLSSLDAVVELEQAALGFDVGGRVAAVAARRGERVKRGQALITLDDSLDRAQRAARKADLDGATARLQLLLAGPRATELRTLDAQVQAMDAQVEAAQRDLSRQEALRARGASTAALSEDLRSRLTALRAEREAASQRLRTLQSGSRPQELRAAAAARDAAQAGLQALDERLRHYHLSAPDDGVLLDVLVREGEVLAPGTPAALFARPQHPYVDVFIPVSAAHAVRVGQPATVRPDGDPRGYPGKVEFLSQVTEYTPRYLLSEEDRANLVLRTRVRVDDPELRLHGGVPCRVALDESPR